MGIYNGMYADLTIIRMLNNLLNKFGVKCNIAMNSGE